MSDAIRNHRLARVRRLLAAIEESITEELVESNCRNCGPVVTHHDSVFCGTCGGQLAGLVDPPPPVEDLARERDAARRMWAELRAGEWGEPGPLGARIEAAKVWGRRIACALYPDDAIRAHLATMESDPEELAEDLAAALARFDREVPR